MTLSIALVAVLGLVLGAGLFAFQRAKRLRVEVAGTSTRLNSLPVYHGVYVALWAALPALAFLTIWMPVQSGLVERTVLATPAGQALPSFEMQRDSILSEARDIATGARDAGFNPESAALAPLFAEATGRYAAMGGGIAIFLVIISAFLAMR
ncbi:MAG TPA: phosphate ABC transporter permease family protein, partial [Rhizobiaceae bacterium]|nr:phosphate ABC transporter permease family protein [Rhizobiaceae bacterium]